MLEGAIEPKAIAKQATKLGFPAVALTDRNGLYAAMPFSEACIGRRASSRSSARCSAVARPGDIGPARRDRLAGAARPGRGRLRQPLPPGLGRAPRPPDPGGAACRVRRARGRDRGPDRADRGRGGGARPAVRRRPGRQGARPMPSGCRRCSPDRLYIELSRRGDPVEEAAEARADRPRLCARPAAGRDQPGRYAEPELPRRARRDAVHRRIRPMSRTPTVATSSPEAWLKPGAGDGGAVRRPARGDRQHRRHRPALRGRRAASAGRSCRASATTRTRRFARDAHAGLDEAARKAAIEDEKVDTIATGSTSRSTSSPAWASPATS